MLIKPEQTVNTNLITALLQTSKGCMSNMAQSCSILLTRTVALLKPHIPPTSLGFSFYRHSASLSLEQSNVSISALEILVPLATMIAPRQSHTRPGFIVSSGVHSNVIFFQGRHHEPTIKNCVNSLPYIHFLWHLPPLLSLAVLHL